MDAGDRTALIALYNGTSGDAWFQNSGWCTDAPLSRWHGVSVDKKGRVVGLNLSSNNLVGKIPKELGSLHNLKVLNLERNKLTGEIPRGLGSLHNLEYLYLQRNMLTGEIPRELGSLHNLEYLYLQGNMLTGKIPKELGSLHNLKELYLERNKLTGEIPRELGSLHNLEYLYLQGNMLTGKIPKELGSLHNLKGLYLERNKLTGVIPRELGSLHNLKGLYLEKNKLTGNIPKELGSLHKLEHLYLRENMLTGKIPKELGSLHNLEHLYLSWNKLTGKIPRELGSLHKLKYLYLQENKLTGKIPKELGFLHNLEHLYLQENMLTGNIPKELGSLHKLEYLYLQENMLTGKIPKELGSLHNLQQLYLSWNKLTGAVPAQLVKLNSLWDLDLAGNNFSGPLPSLEQLKNIFVALAGADSGNEGPTQTAVSSANNAVTASMIDSSQSGPPVYSRRPHEEGREHQVRKVTARVSDFGGDVMAWSFGSTSRIISCPDFELDVPRLRREVPVLIGKSPNESEIVDGEVCLLHPVVTCLAGSGEIFNPPLLLRFSVGDATESGSDVGGSNEDEKSYKTDLQSRFSVVKREEGSSTWVPIEGEIKKMYNGVFVLEAQVSHFTYYALKRAPLPLPWPESIPKGKVKKIKTMKLRNVSLLENKGDRTIELYYWRRRTWSSWMQTLKVSCGFAPVEVSGEVNREILSIPVNVVYNKSISSDESVVLENMKSLEVAWASLEDGDDHRYVIVWGYDTMDPREAMRIGPLPERVKARVAKLPVANDEDVGSRVRASLGK